MIKNKPFVVGFASTNGFWFLSKKFSEIIVQAEAKHLVGTAINVCSREFGVVIVVSSFAIVTVISPEVGDIHIQ